MNCRPVTPEVVDSSPVAPARDFKHLARISDFGISGYRVDTMRFRDELTLLARFPLCPKDRGIGNASKSSFECYALSNRPSDLSPDLSLSGNAKRLTSLFETC